MSKTAGDDAIEVLAEELRQSVSTFVRAVRHSTGTQRSAQSETLDLLDRGGAMNVAALASRRGVTHQTMRLVVAQLEVSGVVRQDADPADGRSRLVTLTSAGRDALERERHARVTNIAEAIRIRLTAQEQDHLRSTILLLDRLARVLN